MKQFLQFNVQSVQPEVDFRCIYTVFRSLFIS